MRRKLSVMPEAELPSTITTKLTTTINVPTPCTVVYNLEGNTPGHSRYSIHLAI